MKRFLLLACGVIAVSSLVVGGPYVDTIRTQAKIAWEEVSSHIPADLVRPASATASSPSGRQALPETYRYASVDRGDIISSVAATGAIAPVATVLVSSEISGQIRELYADFNTPVQKGDVIALIEPAPFRNKADIARAELAMTRAAHRRAQVVLREAEVELQRRRSLQASGAGSAAERGRAETARDLAEAALHEAAAQINRNEAALRQALDDLERTNIRSPVNGMIISRTIEAGQTVAVSLQAPTLFTIAQDLRDMQVNASVDESEIGKIKPGQVVHFTVDAYPGRSFTGSVHQIRKSPQTTQNVVTYTVVVRAENPDLALMPGMTASARFIIAESREVLRAPAAALRFQQSGRVLPGGTARVWVEEGGELRAIPVRVGAADGRMTEVIGELQAGQRIIVGLEPKRVQPSTAKRLIGIVQ